MRSIVSNKIKKENEAAVIHFVKSNRDNEAIINVSDYGAKSKKLKKKRVVKQIFKTSSSYGKSGELLYHLCKHFKPNRILELGTSIGMGSLYMHLGAPKCKLITIEGCPETFNQAKRNLKKYPIEFINSTFNDGIKKLNTECFDLIFIDGHHDGKALLSYVKDLKEYIHDDTIIVLDDIRWSASMLKSWNLLKNSNEFNLSLDFFRIGVLIKRPQQAKEHFVLKA